MKNVIKTILVIASTTVTALILIHLEKIDSPILQLASWIFVLFYLGSVVFALLYFGRLVIKAWMKGDISSDKVRLRLTWASEEELALMLGENGKIAKDHKFIAFVESKNKPMGKITCIVESWEPETHLTEHG